MTEPTATPRRHPLLRLAGLFRDDLRLLLLGVVGLLVGTLLTIAGPWIVATAIDVDLANGDRAGLIRKGVIFAAILAANASVTYGSRVALEIVAQGAMLRLKGKLFDHLVGHDLAFHDRHTSGRLITRVQGDTEALRVLFSDVILALPADLTLFAGMFVVMSIAAPEIVPLVFAVLPPYILLFLLFRKVSPKRFLAHRAVVSKLTGFLTEHIRAMPTLQQFDRVAWAQGRSEELNEEVYGKEVSASLQPVWYINSIMLVRSLGFVLLLVVGAGKIASGALTVGALILGLGYLRQMFGPLMRLSFNLTTLERARAAAVRIAQILDDRPTIVDPPEPTSWPGLAGAVRLEGVHFHYADGPPVLRGVDLEIPAGSKVGIVGSTGSGKSTILNLLLRFRDPIAGRVTIDGVDIRELAVDDLRHRVGLVLQDVHLFPGTVLDNLGADPDEARRALQLLDLDIALDRQLVEGGANLSRGERQLLTFARALIGDPPVLILDEATSAVDPETEIRVQEALARIEVGRTTISVAHRLSTVRDCDRIYVLAAGQVREQGTHDELIDMGGLYAALSQLQQGAGA